MVYLGVGEVGESVILGKFGAILEGRGKEEIGKREARKKGKMERKRREVVKGEEENLKWKGKGMKMSRRLFFFLLVTF